MFYTAYNGTSIFLSLATTTDPTNVNTNEGWTRHGPVFPTEENSKSAALLLKSNVLDDSKQLDTNFLFWGDHTIRVTSSPDLLSWDSVGDEFLTTREDHFDSKLVESGPPPLLLSSGDYIFFYNSAEVGWPDDVNTSYNAGYVILDGKDPTKIVQRSDDPLLTVKYPYQQGTAPYTCNVPNVVFLEAAKSLGGDKFEVFFGAADNTIGSGVVHVSKNH